MIIKDIEKELKNVRKQKKQATGEDLAFLKGYELACVEIKCLLETKAEELERHKLDIYHEVERDYLRDDCDKVSRGLEIELTDKERELVVDEFMDSEAYVDPHAEDWEYFINKIKKGEQ